MSSTTTATARIAGLDAPHILDIVIAEADPGDGLPAIASIAVPLPAWVTRGAILTTAGGARWRVVHATDRHALGVRQLVAIGEEEPQW